MTEPLRMQDHTTPLYLAAQAGHVRVVEKLLDLHADIDRTWAVRTVLRLQLIALYQLHENATIC